jgi:hypothetical protein
MDRESCPVQPAVSGDSVSTYPPDHQNHNEHIQTLIEALEDEPGRPRTREGSRVMPPNGRLGPTLWTHSHIGSTVVYVTGNSLVYSGRLIRGSETSR